MDITTITEKQNLLLEIEKLQKKLKWVQYQEARRASDEVSDQETVEMIDPLLALSQITSSIKVVLSIFDYFMRINDV